MRAQDAGVDMSAGSKFVHFHFHEGHATWRWRTRGGRLLALLRLAMPLTALAVLACIAAAQARKKDGPIERIASCLPADAKPAPAPRDPAGAKEVAALEPVSARVARGGGGHTESAKIQEFRKRSGRCWRQCTRCASLPK